MRLGCLYQCLIQYPFCMTGTDPALFSDTQAGFKITHPFSTLQYRLTNSLISYTLADTNIHEARLLSMVGESIVNNKYSVNTITNENDS